MRIKKFEIGNFIVGIPEDIGPRVIHFSLKKYPDKNVFELLPDLTIDTKEGKWHIYGGHRLWTSPEDNPRSYSLDDKPVRIEKFKEFIKIYGNTEIQNSVEKQIEIKKIEQGLEVNHIIKNIGRWPIKFGAWCLSVMKKGGFAIIPIVPKKVDKYGLLPDRHISLWQYTDISDKRLILNKNFIFVKQDVGIKKPFKIGVNVNENWVAYYVDRFLFVKSFETEKGEYPDFGCNVEVYTNSQFLELETLSPLKIVEPQSIIEYKEIWNIVEIGEIKPQEQEIRKVLKDYLPLG
ncbi:MAG: hypothetical protein NC827_03905 [Candidatus Omnitrophica bacterium]|nr:hypothetical protein [Candidatus Omnitrophota bacterium]MCM8802437.1 hypothetical protein [Candidatus Omnitrophota bacterium]